MHETTKHACAQALSQSVQFTALPDTKVHTHAHTHRGGAPGLPPLRGARAAAVQTARAPAGPSTQPAGCWQRGTCAGRADARLVARACATATAPRPRHTACKGTQGLGGWGGRGMLGRKGTLPNNCPWHCSHQVVCTHTCDESCVRMHERVRLRGCMDAAPLRHRTGTTQAPHRHRTGTTQAPHQTCSVFCKHNKQADKHMQYPAHPLVHTVRSHTRVHMTCAHTPHHAPPPIRKLPAHLQRPPRALQHAYSRAHHAQALQFAASEEAAHPRLHTPRMH